MTSGNRTPTWKERENNRRRERRRRAIAAKIFAGLRTYGNYNLPKHCDNNEVLKALANEAGWIVEPDGTTYRKGCKPVELMDTAGGHSASPSPYASYNPSPYASYNPSPVSSSCPSPTRSPRINGANETSDGNVDNALLPWLKKLSTTAASHPKRRHLYIQGSGSISAPVTPPLSSPTVRSPRRIKIDQEAAQSFLQFSTPPISGQQVFPADSNWLAGICIPNGSTPASPTFSLVSQNPFNPFGSSRMWTPGQSGTCSPIAMSGHEHADVQMANCASEEFAFGSSSNDSTGLVKAWEGERIHEECGPDELELTLGTSTTRS